MGAPTTRPRRACPYPQTLYDPKRFVYEALRLRGTPSAVLLGADGMLAGGPVAGHDAISTFVADVEAELAERSPACRGSAGGDSG